MNGKFNIIKDNFIRVYTKQIECDIPIEKIYIHNIDQITHYIYNIDDITERLINNNLIFKDRFTSLPMKKTVYIDKYFRFSRWNCDCIMYPFSKESEHLIDNFKDNEPYDTYIHFFTSDPISNMYFLKANIIVLFETCEDNIHLKTLSYYISKKMYECGIMNRKVNNKTSYLMDLLERSCIEKRNKNAEEALMVILNEPSKNGVISLTIPELKESVQLYNYQKADIKWMTDIKDKIDKNENSISLTYTDYYKVILQDPYLGGQKEYILFEGQLINVTDENGTVNRTVNISYMGGNIISSVGTGKTIISLGYLVKNFTNDFDNFISFENTLCNYFYKRGKNKGMCCKKKKIDELYCKEHHKTIFIDKRNTIFNKMEIDKAFSLRDQIIEIGEHWNKKKLFKSNASLILCPNQLCDQWVREYYERFTQNEKSKRILLIVTYDQYRNITFGELLFADIIIVSYDFLKNTNYLKRGNINKWSSRQNIGEVLDDIDNEIGDNLSEISFGDEFVDLSVLRILDKFNTKLNILDNFYYKNIIFDEQHELNNNTFNDTLKLFNSKYRWNITATPFANGLNSFVNSISNITNKNFDYINDKIDVDIIKSFSELYRRNTKESIKEEYTQMEITDTLKLLEFTEQERRIYDAHSLNKSNSTKDFLIKLCCDTSIDSETKNLVKNCKTLDEIEAVILNHNKKKLQQIKKIIDEYTNKVSKLEEQVNLGFVPIVGFYFESEFILTIEELRTTLGNIRRTLTVNKKEYNEINRTYTFLRNAIDNIKTIEICPICLDDDFTDIAITKCGHKFCKDCIHQYVEEMGKRGDTKCPKCNIPIKIDEIYLLKENKELELIVTEENNELSDIISRVKSTKIGNIIYFIKNCLKETDKCIIFSQWDLLLSKVGKLLKAENIMPLFCTGTIYMRKRSIKAFQEDPESRIICLSSANCASGINLTAANKIIFIEPVHGIVSHRIDIENQAVGRANRISQTRPIEVIRFIIEDTIEEDIYNDNEKELNYKIEEIIDTEPLRLKCDILEI